MQHDDCQRLRAVHGLPFKHKLLLAPVGRQRAPEAVAGQGEEVLQAGEKILLTSSSAAEAAEHSHGRQQQQADLLWQVAGTVAGAEHTSRLHCTCALTTHHCDEAVDYERQRAHELVVGEVAACDRMAGSGVAG